MKDSTAVDGTGIAALTILAFFLIASPATSGEPERLKYDPSVHYKGQQLYQINGLENVSDARVLAVTKDLVTVDGWFWVDAARRQLRQVLVIRFNDLLAEGGVCENSGDYCAYRAKDIKVGDTVTLHTFVDPDDRQRYVGMVTIWERPNGEVPPSQKPHERRPFHEVQNELLKSQRTGKPIPDELRRKWGDLPPLKTATGQDVPASKETSGGEGKSSPARIPPAKK